MSRSRCPGSFCKQHWSNRRISDGVAAGSARPVRLALEDARERIGHRRTSKRALARQHLVEHAAKRPDIGAFVHRQPARLLRAHVRRRAEDDARLRPVRRDGRRPARDQAQLHRRRPSFASPKSSTFTAPAGVIFMLAGLRSRWTMPLSCAASSASAICRAIGRASHGNRSRVNAISERLALRRAPGRAHGRRRDSSTP